MITSYDKIIGWVVAIILSIYFVALICVPINLHSADLGRYLKNGELTITQGIIPSTTLYSYVNPDQPFINHHWGTGVIFYVVYQVGGFVGLSLFYALISLSAFLLLFYLATKYVNGYIATLVALVAIPMICFRSEIRPEGLSNLLIASFIFILFQVRNKGLSQQFLFVLPLLELLWVNIHIYFPFGLVLIGLFLVEQWFVVWRKKTKRWIEVKPLVLVGIMSSLVIFINPFGLSGVLYPLHIFDSYGYRVLENQSVLELMRLISYATTPYFFVLAVLFLLSLLIGFLSGYRNQKWIGGYSALAVFGLLFLLMSWQAVRNFALFGYICLLVIPLGFKVVLEKIAQLDKTSLGMYYGFVLFIALMSTFYLGPQFWQARRVFSPGVYPRTENAALFFKEQKMKGPIFNNYDNGGYLTFYLYPEERVFVDNRPESYPVSFFQDLYIPMQLNNAKWKEESAQYQFNTIFFYRHDLTNWAQHFLVERIKDSEWVPVYVDDFAIIFVKNDKKNREIIDMFRLPKEMFNVK